MINHWWVTRPKRRLNSVPEVLAAFAEISLDQEWQGQRGTHLSFEDALEEAGLKRKGERRDHTGGGARTYTAWLVSLGLIFIQESTGQMKLTLAGEAVMAGESPVEILKGQILKYQFPSSFSLSRGVSISSRFKIRPFRFILRLLADSRIQYLTEEEIAKIVIVEAENETEQCFNRTTEKICMFRQRGDSVLDSRFFEKYAPKTGTVNKDHPFSHLMDTANTFINWIEYTQLAKRGDGDRRLRIIQEKAEEVAMILSESPSFIDRPEQHEYFQRKYGLDPRHRKDTRNMAGTRMITAEMIAEQKVKQAFIGEALRHPINRITSDLIDSLADKTGIEAKFVERALNKLYPHGAIGAFMSQYFEMAFKGRDNAAEFEKATAEIFGTMFGYKAEHVGPKGLTPDVLILSDEERYCAVIDNKAYSRYTISNDHKNRMLHNYIGNLGSYYDGRYSLAFFSYIAGGFGQNIDSQIREIADASSVHGSAVSVTNMIKLIERNSVCGIDHARIRDIFSVDRQVLLSDLD